MTFNKNYMLLEDSYVEFLIEHNLTQGQYLLLHLLHKSRGDLIRKYKEAFPSGDSTMIGEYFIKDLVNKGLLEEDRVHKFRLTNKFYEIFTNKHTATEEIFDIYPTHGSLNGVQIPLTAMDRNVFANLYDTKIKSSVLEHLEVMKDIDYAIKNNLLNIGIEKFLKSEYWKAIRPKRLENNIETRTITALDYEF